MRLLSPDCLLLLLCSHGAQHRWWQLKWVCDIAELLRQHPGLDWERVSLLAARSGNSRVLHLGLLLAHDLLAGDVPADVVQLARADRVVTALAAEVIASLGVALDPAAVQLELLAFNMRVKERLSDRGKLLLSYLLQPGQADEPMVTLPPAFSCFTGLLQPFRRLQRYGADRVKYLFWQQS